MGIDPGELRAQGLLYLLDSLDPELHRFYDQLRLITRSERLLSGERLRAIVAMNAGKYDGLVNGSDSRHGGSVATLEQVAAIRQNGSPGNAEGNHILTASPATLYPEP